MACYDRIAQQWHRVTGVHGGPLKELVLNDKVLESIPAVAGGAILEVGAGNGYFMPLLLRRLGGQVPRRIVITDQSERLLGDALPDPASGNGVPRAEVYLWVDDPDAYHQRALAAGARQLSPLEPRDWGHVAAYSIDPDGHVLAFARPHN